MHIQGRLQRHLPEMRGRSALSGARIGETPALGQGSGFCWNGRGNDAYRLGKAAVFAGMAVGTMLTATSCDSIIPQPLEGDVPYIPDSTEMPNPDDTIPEEAFLLEGDVLAPEPDSLQQCSNKDEFDRLEGEPPVSPDDPNLIKKGTGKE